MKPSEQDYLYFNGESFSTAFKFKFTSGSCPYSRLDLLENIVKDKNVIHLGCCDHVDLLNEKIKSNQWLHSRIYNSSKKCVGVDISQEGINILKKMGYPDLICADITKLDGTREYGEITKTNWDYLLIPEVIEHIGNPASFLSDIHRKFKGVINELIITVPNAFSISNIKYSYHNTESINSDHRFWFTPFTIAKLVCDGRFTVENIWLCEPVVSKNIFGVPNPMGYLKEHFYNNHPLYRQTIVLKAKF